MLARPNWPSHDAGGPAFLLQSELGRSSEAAVLPNGIGGSYGLDVSEPTVHDGIGAVTSADPQVLATGFASSPRSLNPDLALKCDGRVASHVEAVLDVKAMPSRGMGAALSPQAGNGERRHWDHSGKGGSHIQHVAPAAAPAASAPGGSIRGELIAFDAEILVLADQYKASNGVFANGDPFFGILLKSLVKGQLAITENSRAVAVHVLRQLHDMVTKDRSHWMFGKGGGVEKLMLELEALRFKKT